MLKRHDVPLAMPPAPGQIGWASFACILLRGAMVQAIGPMDDGYFLYFEDTEYCLRAARAGWQVAYVAQARCVHFRGGSGPVKAMAAAKQTVAGLLLCLAHPVSVSGAWRFGASGRPIWPGFWGAASAQLRRSCGQAGARRP